MSHKCNSITPVGRSSARVTAALLMGTFLVGCTAPGTGPGVSRYEPTYLRLTEEQQFAQALRQRYVELATNAFDRGDMKRSDFYSLRALMAAEGKLAHPGQASRSVAPGDELIAAGKRLEAAFARGARIGSPDLAARAQAAYDCWLVEVGGSGDAQIAQSCRYNAMKALTELEGGTVEPEPLAAPIPVIVPQVQPVQAHNPAPTQSYVVESGAAGSQVINAPGGYTIEIITQHHAPTVIQQHTTVPARYTTVQPVRRVVQSAPAPVQFVDTVPIRSEVMSLPAPIEVQAFDLAPTVALETIPLQQEVALAPAYQAQPMPYSVEPTIDLGPIGAVPVFNTTPVETIPMVEIASLPRFDDEAANSLLEIAASTDGQFSIFFGFDSDEVTLEGEDVLIDAIEQIRLSGVQRVTLMGFTDSVGNARYNQLLAMRRAQSVRKFLQTKLGTGIEFEILPVGELQAVRSGGDGVKEALNRKVEIGFR